MMIQHLFKIHGPNRKWEMETVLTGTKEHWADVRLLHG